jgi:hypothetical protein
MPDELVVFLLVVTVALGIGCIYSNCGEGKQ